MMSLALATAALLNAANPQLPTVVPQHQLRVPEPQVPFEANVLIPAESRLAIAVTYRDQLKAALSVGEWEEANRLTSIILLQSVKQYGRGYLIAKDIRQIPCPTLREVNHWWSNSSNGHFGFSTQANLWHQMKGKTFDDVTQFENQIGWLGELDFLSTITAPKGHLPLRPVKPKGMPDAWGGGWIQEMPKRLIACNIIQDPNPPAPKPAASPSPSPAPSPKPKPSTSPAPTPKPSPSPKPAPSPKPSPSPKPAPAPKKPTIRLRDILPPVEPRR